MKPMVSISDNNDKVSKQDTRSKYQTQKKRKKTGKINQYKEDMKRNCFFFV